MLFFTNHVKHTEICPVSGPCYTPGDPLDTSFVAFNAETGFDGVLGGWFVDATLENVDIETVQSLCADSGDTAIVVDAGIENPSGAGDLVVSIVDEDENTLDSYGIGGGMPAGWPATTQFALIIPGGTLGKLRVTASVVGFMATYDKILIAGVDLSP